MGKEIVSSADLVSQFQALITESQIATHYEAQRRIDSILAEAWPLIGQRSRSTAGTHEFDIVTWLQEAIAREGMVTEHGPNVSAGPNSADSHYEPTQASSKPIRAGDFLLIDIWAKLAGDPEAVWYDITWTGVVGREPSEREQQVFYAVRDARDAAISVVEAALRGAAADRRI